MEPRRPAAKGTSRPTPSRRFRRAFRDTARSGFPRTFGTAGPEFGVPDDPERPGHPPDADARRLDSTFDLIERVRQGDQEALERLFARHLTPLQRWASGRLPRWARDLADTDDLVQDTLLERSRVSRTSSLAGRRAPGVPAAGGAQSPPRRAAAQGTRTAQVDAGRPRMRGRRVAARGGDRPRGGRALRAGARAAADRRSAKRSSAASRWITLRRARRGA